MPARTFRRLFADVLVALLLRVIYLFGTFRLVVALRDPMQEQNRLLLRILRKNRETTFGRKHGFADIISYDDYRTRVPVAGIARATPASRPGCCVRLWRPPGRQMAR